MIFFNKTEYIYKIKKLGSKNHIKAFEIVLEIAKAVKEAGGRAFLVYAQNLEFSGSEIKYRPHKTSVKNVRLKHFSF